jgi:hypothetical protein
MPTANGPSGCTPCGGVQVREADQPGGDERHAGADDDAEGDLPEQRGQFADQAPPGPAAAIRIVTTGRARPSLSPDSTLSSSRDLCGSPVACSGQPWCTRQEAVVATGRGHGVCDSLEKGLTMIHVFRTAAGRAVVAAAAAVAQLAFTPAASAEPAPKKYANCTALLAKYPHGVGRPHARDHVSGTSRPITTFTRDAATYAKNSGLDRDHDGIACEKR